MKIPEEIFPPFLVTERKFPPFVFPLFSLWLKFDDSVDVVSIFLFFKVMLSEVCQMTSFPSSIFAPTKNIGGTYQVNTHHEDLSSRITRSRSHFRECERIHCDLFAVIPTHVPIGNDCIDLQWQKEEFQSRKPHEECCIRSRNQASLQL